MSDLYLWDKKGPRDPFVVKLENELAPRRYRPFRPKACRPRWSRLVASCVAASFLVCGFLWIASERSETESLAAPEPAPLTEKVVVAKKANTPPPSPRIDTEPHPVASVTTQAPEDEAAAEILSETPAAASH